MSGILAMRTIILFLDLGLMSVSNLGTIKLSRREQTKSLENTFKQPWKEPIDRAVILTTS